MHVKGNPEIFSVYDFKQWCINHKYDENSIHSTFVPYYYINNINDIFVLFTTKQLLKDTQFSSLLQVDATYKLTWNELPLLVFGSSDADRHFRPFGVALVSSDEGSACYIDLFKQLKLISAQENQREYIVNYVMADGAPGNICFYLNSFSIESFIFRNNQSSKGDSPSSTTSYVLGTCRSKMPRT